MVKLVFKFISAILFFIITHKWTCVGQLSTRETLNTTTECSLNDVNFDCGNAKVLAMQTVVFGYSTGCDATCCEPDSSHCHELAESSEILYVRRECSGRQSCTVDLDGDRSFCSIGTRPPSYVTVSYQCIPESRIASICSTTTLTSDDGSPLYLTNPNYPGVTTGDSTCSCSLEVFDCSSIVALYIIDADLYLDTATCEQRLDFKNGDGTILKTIACESYYYSTSIQSDSLNGHYVKVDFTDNSVTNHEGYFFLAFEASDSTKNLSLSCTAQAESWCVVSGLDFTSDPQRYVVGSEGTLTLKCSVTESFDAIYNIRILRATEAGANTSELLASLISGVPTLNGNLQNNRDFEVNGDRGGNPPFIEVSMNINKMTYSDARAYSCEASIEVFSDSVLLKQNVTIEAFVETNVTSLSANGITSSTGVFLNIGDSLSIQCIAEGNPNADITLTMEDGLSKTIYGGTILQYNVEHVTYSNSGIYICTGRNNYSQECPSRREIAVIVKEVHVATERSDMTGALIGSTVAAGVVVVGLFLNLWLFWKRCHKRNGEPETSQATKKQNDDTIEFQTIADANSIELGRQYDLITPHEGRSVAERQELYYESIKTETDAVGGTTPTYTNLSK